MGKAGKVLKPKQNTAKHHKHEAAYERNGEQSVASAVNESEKGKKK